MLPRISVRPALLNSASPWATTSAELSALYLSPFTGAVTTRTALATGAFPHDERVHQHTFFAGSSLNTYGYSPSSLASYLSWIREIVRASGIPQAKPFIVSVTGAAEEVAAAVEAIADFAENDGVLAWAEINLSCPNIPDRPPPAYSAHAFEEYLRRLPQPRRIPVGVKIPPYAHQQQFDDLLGVVERYPETLAFITATNSLGGALHLSAPPPPLAVDAAKAWQPTLPSAAGTGVGGLAGEAIHCLALGNVDSLRRGLERRGLADIGVIGVGGVADRDGMERMLAVGAAAVAVATALGRDGVGIFEEILTGKDTGADVGLEGKGFA